MAPHLFPAALPRTGSLKTSRGLRLRAGLVGLAALAGVAGFTSASVSAQVIANPSAAPGQRPQVQSTMQGKPLVQIVAPNAAGVSHNRYSRFDVDARGVILNNSRSTQIDGMDVITLNRNLRDGPARIILNEVNAPQASLLQGPVRVVGSRAEVIIANPAGITCNGCGFVNASRALLTTGQVQAAPGGLPTFSVQQGTVAIGPQGLSGQGADATDIVAANVTVGGGMTAKALSITAGKGNLSLDANGVPTFVATAAQVTPGGSQGRTNSIDVSELGGMYANSIRLVATDGGVAVHGHAILQATTGDLTITASGALVSEGPLWAGGNASLRGQSVRLDGMVLVDHDLSVTSDADLRAGALLVGLADANSAQAGTARLSLVAGGKITASDLLWSSGRLSLQAQAIELLPSSAVFARGSAQAQWRQSFTGSLNQITVPGSFVLPFGADNAAGGFVTFESVDPYFLNQIQFLYPRSSASSPAFADIVGRI